MSQGTDRRKIAFVNNGLFTTEPITGEKGNMDEADILIALKSDKLVPEPHESSSEIDSGLKNEVDLLPNYLDTICYQDIVTDIEISPNGDYIATRTCRTVKLVEVATEQEIAVIFHSNGNGIRGIQFSSDGDYLVTRSFDGTTKLIQVSTGKEIGLISDPSNIKGVDFKDIEH